MQSPEDTVENDPDQSDQQSGIVIRYNDIRPARQIGCQTIWLKGEPWDSEASDNSASYSDEADRVITNILDLI